MSMLDPALYTTTLHCNYTTTYQSTGKRYKTDRKKEQMFVQLTQSFLRSEQVLCQ